MALSSLSSQWRYGSYESDRNWQIQLSENAALRLNDTDISAYYDGSIAIGYGFDLLVRSNEEINFYLRGAGIVELSDADRLELDQARAAQQLGLSSDELARRLRTVVSNLSLRLADQAQAASLLDFFIESNVEPYLDQKLGYAMPQSRERAALISLAYQRGRVGTELIGPKLIAAITNDDRAEAWFEIRYNSGQTFANRRYAESDLFGLYNGTGGIGEDHAVRIYQMYTRHKETIETYERSHAPRSSETFTIEQNLLAAYEVLSDKYTRPVGITVAVKDIKIGESTQTAWISTRSDEGKDDDTLLGSTRNDLLVGESGDDVLVGYGGRDVLVGGAGNDVLYGLEQADVLDGGEGSDILYGGTGSDALQGGHGHDTYVFDPADLAAADIDRIVDPRDDGGSDGEVFVSSKGRLTGADAEQISETTWRSDDGTEYRRVGSSLVISGTWGKGKIVINNWTDGRFGITLRDDDDADFALDQLRNGIDATYRDFLNTFGRRDPLVLDLDGDGIETTAEAGANGVAFDHDNDGVRTPTGWVAADDGLLVLDRNGNGSIDNGTEIFGDSTPDANGQSAANGIEALRALDENRDGTVDGNDTQFADLRVWRDFNQNGLSEAGELFSLSDLGIASLAPNSPKSYSSELPGGNWMDGAFAYNRIDGSQGTVGEVWFRESSFATSFTDPVVLTDQAKVLPDVQGTGMIRNLREAMSLDASGQLTQLVAQYANALAAPGRTTTTPCRRSASTRKERARSP